MTFSLEAVFALHGDALILHYGPTDPHPNWILIDGGARGTYRNFLEPRLKQLKEDWQIDGSIPLQMVMVSHIDSDHIAGVLDLFKNLKDNRQTPLCEVGNLWHNSFDDVIGNEDEELISKLVKPPGGVPVADDDDMDVRETEAVAASVGQGRDLRLDAEAIGITTNSPFEGRSASKPALVLANSEEIPQGHGLTFQVLAPDINRVKTYQEKWNKYLKEKGLEEVEASAFNDPSAFNLASIVVLARMGGHEMLLTGDARGDYIVNGLVEAGLLDSDAA